MTDGDKNFMRRLHAAEAQIRALQDGEIDAIVDRRGVNLLRLRELEEKLEQSELRYRRLIQANIIGVITAGETKIREANDIFLEMIGCSRKELSEGGIDWRNMTPPEYLPRDQKAFEELLEKGHCSPFEKEYIRKDGTRVPILIGASLLSPKPLTWICFVMDLTEPKLLETALRRSHAELEQRVRERTASLQKKSRRLRILNSTLRQEIARRLEYEALLEAYNQRITQEHSRRLYLSKHLVEILEKERREIAGELHDGIGQLTAALKMDLELLERRLDGADVKRMRPLQSAKQKLLELIDFARTTSQQLRPTVLDTLGLVPALRSLLSSFEKSRPGIEVNFFSREIPEKMDSEIETAVYRVVQEAMTNCVKHADAKTVHIHFAKRDRALFLTFEDDGKGFDFESVSAHAATGKGCQGITIMRERLFQLGGEFRIESALGKGTVISGRIPVE